MADHRPKVTITNLAFYFDGLERDRYDRGKQGQRLSDLMKLREELLKLPDEFYTATIEAISSLVTVAANKANPDATNGKNPSSDAASRLYDETSKKREKRRSV